jgi:hypothetical protein
MEHKKFAVVILAAVIASLMLAGTILAPIQSYAAAKRGSEADFPDTSSLKHAVRDGVSANLSHRDQHLNQQNLCYRTNTCRQSDVGQNTQGNDNQVTGFADQSDNLQQSITANNTTPTLTPTPTTATLTVTKVVSGNTAATPSQFTIHVTGNNPTPANFAGSETGIDVKLDPGAFNVTETQPTGNFDTTTTSDCSGTIRTGQHLSCTIINNAKTQDRVFITINRITCTDLTVTQRGVSVEFTVSGVFHDSQSLTYLAQLISPSGNVVHSAQITIPANAPNPASTLIVFSDALSPGTYKIIATPNGEFASATFDAPDCSL